MRKTVIKKAGKNTNEEGARPLSQNPSVINMTAPFSKGARKKVPLAKGGCRKATGGLTKEERGRNKVMADEVEGQEEVVESPKKAEKAKFSIMTLLLPLFVAAAIMGGILGYCIRTNKFDVGEILRPSLKNIPVVKMILPANPNAIDLTTLSQDELIAMINDQENKINVLNKNVSDLQKYKDMKNAVDAQKIENDTNKQAVAQERTQLQADKLKFATEVTKLDSAGFMQYYEKFDSGTAQKIYEKLVKQTQKNQKITNYISSFESMDSASAAKILEQMGAQNLDLVANIMNQMRKELTPEILSNMTPAFAATLADRMAIELPIYP
jgi:flagellar motility protein MotE (MotC chaperone)